MYFCCDIAGKIEEVRTEVPEQSCGVCVRDLPAVQDVTDKLLKSREILCVFYGQSKDYQASIRLMEDLKILQKKEIRLLFIPEIIEITAQICFRQTLCVAPAFRTASPPRRALPAMTATDTS
ncbi:hypothetical protein SRHO_G00252880 [Serrasalmus rhombeus]